MKDLIEALTILSKYTPQDSYAPTHCEHDLLYVIDVSEVSKADALRLDELGFSPGEDEGQWISYRFGSA